MPGWQGRQVLAAGYRAGRPCPVVLDPAQPGGWGSRTPSHFELTELGRRSLLTKLADTQDDNTEVWEGLPGFQWYAAVLRAKAGQRRALRAQGREQRIRPVPLLVTRTFGAGKVLFMGTDGAWRWRKGVEDKYHYRFWGQVVRWMAYQRNMAKGETMRLYYAPDQPQVQPDARPSRQRDGAEAASRFMAATSRRGSRLLGQGRDRAASVPPATNGESSPAYFTPQEPGSHAVPLFCKQTGATLEASFFVQGCAVEPSAARLGPRCWKRSPA